VTRLPAGENPDGFSVRLKNLPARRVAYLRVLRPFEGDRVPLAAARLLAWARARGLAGGQWLGYQWEDPTLVPLERCRYDVAVEVPADHVVDTRSEGDQVHEARFPPMMVAELEIAGGLEKAIRALEWLYGTWLPASGYAPDHQPCFEAWNGEPYAHGASYFEVRTQLAVVDAWRPLATPR